MNLSKTKHNRVLYKELVLPRCKHFPLRL